ncbi:MAG: guanylate kinase, partial [Sandaracinaceae bacterium]|nr:guanylate kinase [Sandaracinaceae bacterium]
MDELLLLILCSPSGAGKTTLTRHLLAQMPELTFSVSHTTRKPRANETHGSDYHFVDRPAFQRMVDEGRFAEWAEVHGNFYGTSTDELARAKAQGKRGIVFDIDYQGARQIKARLPRALGVFVLPPSMSELHRRLEGRATETQESLARRFAKAREEIEHYPFFDYLVVNDDLERAKQSVVAIARAELSARWRVAPLAEALLRH